MSKKYPLQGKFRGLLVKIYWILPQGGLLERIFEAIFSKWQWK